MKIEEIEITPEVALGFLQLNSRNRARNDKHIMFLADQMATGKWVSNGEPYQFSSNNELLNGQHRLFAIIKSNTTQHGVIETEIDGDVFGTYDTGKKRTAGDVFHVNGVESSVALASMVRAYMALNMGILGSSNIGSANTKTSIVDIYNKYSEKPDLFGDILHKANMYCRKLRILKPSEVGSYMAYLVLDKGHTSGKVESFFKQLCFSEGVENTTINIIRDKLINSGLTGFKMTSKHRRALITKTWNAYIRGREVKVLTFNENKEELPDFI